MFAEGNGLGKRICFVSLADDFLFRFFLSHESRALGGLFELKFVFSSQGRFSCLVYNVRYQPTDSIIIIIKNNK